MYDYDGDMKNFQKKLDDAGVDFDISNLCGCTFKEISEFVYVKTHRKCPVCKKVYFIEKGQNQIECEDCGTVFEVNR